MHGTRQRRMATLAIPVLVALLAGNVVALARGNEHAPPGRLGASIAQLQGQLATDLRRAETARNQQVTALLNARAQAVRAHNLTGFLATVDPSRRAFYAAQRTTFTNRDPIPFSAFSYTLDTRSAETSAPAGYAPAPTWNPQVTLSFRLGGFDPTPTAGTEFYTFVERGNRWLIGGENDLAAQGQTSQPEIWDSAPVVVARGTRSLVLGHAGNPLLAQLAATVDRDIPRVTAIWGSDWAQEAVVEVPSTAKEFAALIGGSGDLSQIEAVQTHEAGASGSASQGEGNRITINPTPFAQLSTVGRTVVLTHELTHVASSVFTTAATPKWLVEGLADYAGFLNSGLPVSAVGQELATEIRSSGLPTALPPDSAYGATAANLAASYEQGWLACRLLAARYGQAALIRFYRQVGSSDATPDAAVAAALRTVGAQSVAAFTAAWRDYVRAQLG